MLFLSSYGYSRAGWGRISRLPRFYPSNLIVNCSSIMSIVPTFTMLTLTVVDDLAACTGGVCSSCVSLSGAAAPETAGMLNTGECPIRSRRLYA